MTPRHSIDDLIDRVPSHAERRGQCLVRFPLRRPPAYLVYLLGVQLLATPRTLPPLANRVVHVRLLRAEEQMRRVDTARVVAVMQDTETRWDVAAGQEPRQPVGAHANVLVAELAVATRGHIP